ncbi:MAG: molybdenum cofactor guanylyltransferase, partial [Candidatus Omnitrophota bacterium]|nr:molybdenum cofactor guanylyltransferase [Candidatus Omnitrophota bacterium]
MGLEITGIVLAGGKAARMRGSCDKAFLKVGGKTIIDRQLKALRNIFKEIMIVTNSPDRYKDRKGVKIIPDLVREKGPLGGIYSGLSASGSFYNFVTACDMPFINEGLVKYMIK